MESMVSKEFFRDKVILVTGHTGFKGAWLSFWLSKLGAKVIGVSLKPIYNPNIYDESKLKDEITSLYIDIRDGNELKKVFDRYKPHMVFHLAAQPLVKLSYENPVETYDINIVGTANVLFEAFKCESTKGVVNITTDKCYENKEWIWAYRENDQLGGYDPYSSSKAASEILTTSFRKSFFEKEGKFLATVRAGNVIGGGDWSKDRIVPDIIRSIFEGDKLVIRSGSSIRPFQHVLEPLYGYMTLMEKLWNNPQKYSEAWNFGPNKDSIICVERLTKEMLKNLEIDDYSDKVEFLKENNGVHEARILKLDSTKANEILGWTPKLSIEQSLKWTSDWYKSFYDKKNMREYTLNQIENYENL